MRGRQGGREAAYVEPEELRARRPFLVTAAEELQRVELNEHEDEDEKRCAGPLSLAPPYLSHLSHLLSLSLSACLLLFVVLLSNDGES